MLILNNSGPVKLLGVIAGVVILNISILSPGLLGVAIGGSSTLETATGITLLVVSLLIVLYGSYTLLFKRAQVHTVPPLETRDDYIAELNRYLGVRVLKEDVGLAIDQMMRMDKKKLTLLNVLAGRFEREELSFRKFHTVIQEVEKLLYLNIRSILSKLSVFDAAEFSQFTGTINSGRFPGTFIQKKNALFNEYFSHIKGGLAANEEILLKLDQLLLEISRLGSTDYDTALEMPCMQELTALIGQTKLYQ
ncbi:hypothetical protein [Paenibacillus borealis]|uniref:hypothetical protein n=1 Tax=Paenibacillus borealis TaxID=160799 RepID=UPI000AC2DA6F|nr:hypothetical protein [Paenibacillus borealis]